MLEISDKIYKSRNIISLEQARSKIIELKKKKLKIGLAAGCFDLIHPGHIKYFQSAKNLCDVLIVSVSDYKQVRKRKGRGRPILPTKLAAYTVSQSKSVDYVVINPYKRNTKIIRLLMPDYYIKGKEYRKKNTPGIKEERKTITETGGIMLYTDDEPLSTTKIINYIKEEVE